jgi:hypothetical protein
MYWLIREFLLKQCWVHYSLSCNTIYWCHPRTKLALILCLVWQDAVSHLIFCEFYKIILCCVMGDFFFQGSSESKLQVVRMVHFQADGCNITFCFMWQTNTYATKCPGSQSAYWSRICKALGWVPQILFNVAVKWLALLLYNHSPWIISWPGHGLLWWSSWFLQSLHEKKLLIPQARPRLLSSTSLPILCLLTNHPNIYINLLKLDRMR